MKKKLLTLSIASLCSASQAFAEQGHLDLTKVFQGSPWIYLILAVLSIASLMILLYSLWTWRIKELMPEQFMIRFRTLINENEYESALHLCKENPHFSAQILASGIAARKHGPHMMREAMSSEGRRCAQKLWQRITFLNEVAFVAPMLGLLGTVIGLFFAFYDTQRTTESIAAVFDGLGIAVGTTVAGLVVAILAMVFASFLKYRAVNLMTTLENELLPIVNHVEYPS